MSETELSVICKNCGSEVSPYVTECPYCGARLRKRAPKLERRDGALEAQRPRRRRRLLPPRPAILAADRPYATLVAILGPAIMLLIQKATGYQVVSLGGLGVPFAEEWWRYLSAPFAYIDVGYLFVVALALAIFSTGVERRLGTAPTAILIVACGSLGMLAAVGVANAQDDIVYIAGGNGIGLGMLAAWFVLRRAEAKGAIDQEYDWIGVAVCAAVLLLLPLFSGANVVAGLAGGVVGGLAGLLTALVRPSHR
ncbi:MAG TPA: rhomboid family intramembrane serine protease [Solirubrobacterales bacterium]|jgi:membrane associated rhomboid family serine protease|nr:rhomboid family intramembrane serine protease [Solirubrobacterales bacterium]